jgi:hypothetical protein
MTKPLVAIVVDEIIKCAEIRGSKGYPIDCSKAFAIFVNYYNKKDRKGFDKNKPRDFAFSYLRDYLWFDEGEKE